MNVINYKRIQDFLSIHRDSRSFMRMVQDRKESSLQNLAEVKQVYPSLTGRSYTVFNIAGNKYRTNCANSLSKSDLHRRILTTESITWENEE